MSDRRKIRWLIAHFPVHLFQRTAEAFGRELETLCPGQFELEIHTLDTFAEKYSDKYSNINKRMPRLPGLEDKQGIAKKHAATDVKEMYEKWDTFFDGLREGDFEMSQTQVFTVAEKLHNKDFAALDLPFLFDNHDHVSRVLDGEIGDELCKGLENEKIRGLAFTYSGGYRIIGSTNGLSNLSDLAHTDLIVANRPSEVLFGNGFGTPILRRSEVANASLAEGVNDGMAVETTYIRFTGKHVLKTNHSIFMTTILTGTKFLDSLTEDQRNAFMVAAKRVAKIEREWSVADAEKYERDAVTNGVTIIDLSEEDQALLQKRAKLSYRHVEDMGIDVNLVKRIIERRKD
jgi:hypothetical protein